jgi:FkbM family methyltransferase
MAAVISISKRDDGLYWPDIDVEGYKWINDELYMTDTIIETCSKRRSIIHGGANVGTYTLKYANAFDRVYSFEPDRVNFRCLSLNTVDKDNVFLYQAALGNQYSTVSLVNGSPDNCGAFAVIPKGDIPMLTIDTQNLNDVDCIHLDAEGFEFFILHGAINTMNKSSPLIVVEWFDHGERYGWRRNDLIDFLVSIGYNNMKQIGSDMMFRK